jgi:GDPmannose 4,6-dehydratase
MKSAASGAAQEIDEERLALGDLSIRRDWGWAPDYVEAMWAMTQLSVPDDFVTASGTSHSIQEFVAAAFAEGGRDWREHVDYDPALKRPSDIAASIGDPAKAQRILGWRAKVQFRDIVGRMVRSEREGPAAVS